MKSQGRFHIGRIAAFFMIGALGLLSVGDRAFAVVSRGIDPLDTLDRTAKPNVIVVLDNSTSMRNTPYFNGGVGPGTGDWALSKLATAKAVLQTTIANNQSRANFMLASYQQSAPPAFTTGSDRFYYVLSSTSAPAFAGTPFTHSTWQDVQAGWNTLYWQESSGSAPINPVITIGAGVNDKFYFREARSTGFLDRYRTCTVTLPASLYGAHGNGTADPNFATLLAGLNPLLTAANGSARSCTTVGGGVGTTPDNDYTLSYNAGTFTFTLNVDIAGASSGTPREYQILFDSNTLMDDLGFPISLPHTGLTLANAGVPNAGDYQQTANNLGADVSTVGIVNPVACSASVPATFYSSGVVLATALTTAMNAALLSCTPTPGSNTYAVTFDALSGVFTFARVTGTLPFQIRWSFPGPPVPTNNIAGILGKGGAADSSFGASVTSGATTKLADYQGVNSQTTDLIAGVTTTNYALAAGRFFNGQTLRVDATGAVCSVTAGSATSPPTVIVQPTLAGCGADTGGPSTFQLAGANWGTDVSGTAGVPGTGSCQGYRSVVDLVACNTATPQATTFATALSPGLILNPGSPYAPTGYTEVTNDGSYRVSASPAAAGLIAFAGNTPLASAISGVRGAFTTLYSAGNFGLSAISSHTQPRERTIVVMITDGQDSCAIDLGTGSDNNALAAAYQAQLMYQPISGALNSDGTYTAATDVASSATLYVVGFGNGINTAIDTDRLNWMAWGGSGLGPQMGNNGTRWTTTPTSAQREQCATCNNAFIALDGPSLTTVLQAVIDQATSSEGVFSATQAIQASPFELADSFAPANAGSMDPETRYDVLAPLGFESIFTMPGFRGTIRAIGNSGGTPFVFWDAGAKLLSGSTNSIQTTMNLAIPVASSPTGIAGEGSFQQLHNNATDANVRTAANVGIRRRIYTTAGNGTFPVVDNQFARLFAGDSPCRVPLWPPTSAPSGPTSSCLGNSVVAPADNTTEGLLDVALGLPSDAQIGADPIGTFNSMQSYYEVCVASPPASAAPSPKCLTATPSTDVEKALRARREARETILAYIAGASVVLDTAGYPKRAAVSGSGFAAGDIIYKARPWAMAESTLSSAAVVGPPIEITPGTTGFVDEYNKYKDGPRNVSNVGVNGLAQGFGLRNPDKDNTSASFTGDDSGRDLLKPVMTTVYVGANDMLHAFRAAPNCNNPAGNFSGCTETGGEELWGFVPFDRLFVLRGLLKPQTRGNKTYVIASGVRFADAFINAPGGSYSVNIGGVPVTGRGVWRQVVAFGRGQGGKYYTVLDVTARGPFTGRALDTPGPQVLWSRGNPDTIDGTPAGNPNGSGADTTAYSKMGETWSVPAISFVDKNVNNGASVVLYTGSGYGDSANAGEGAFFYTLDAITGAVIGSVDVEAAAAANGVTRSGLGYPNSVVAGPAAFSARQLTPLQAGHPSEITTRAYFGDLHGRLWKINGDQPNTAVLMADLGVDQPVGVSPALIGLGEPVHPFIYVTSGNDSRVVADFKIFGFKDTAGDGNSTAGTRTPSTAAAPPPNDPTVFEYPPQSLSQFVRRLEDAAGDKYRGTIQPATAFTEGSPANGRVFFGGTRFTGFNNTIPCLATFNTILFALGAETGGAAYDLSSSGDDAYVVFTNSRKLAIQVIRQPGATPGSTQPAKLYLDEGLMSGATSPNPPAAPGVAAAIVPQPPSVTLTLRQGATQSVFPQFAAPRVCQ